MLKLQEDKKHLYHARIDRFTSPCSWGLARKRAAADNQLSCSDLEFS